MQFAALIVSLVLLSFKNKELRSTLAMDHEKNCAQTNIYHNSIQIDTSKIAILPFDQLGYIVFKNVKASDLSVAEINSVRSLIEAAVLEHNKMVKGNMRIDDLETYRFQVIPVINEKGEKLVWVNSFCGNNARFTRIWRKEVVAVDDGGNCFFNLKINLTTKTSFDLMVNGQG